MGKECVRVAEIAEILKINIRSVQRRAKRENWPVEFLNKRGDKKFRMQDLPCDVQKALVGKCDVTPDLLPVLAPEAALAAVRKMVGEPSLYKGIANIVPDVWSDETAIGMDVIRDQKVAKWIRILQEAKDVPQGWKKRKWIERVAEGHGTSFQTVYRKMKAYEKKGLAGLKHTKTNGKKAKAWDEAALDFWIGLCLKKAHRKMAKDALYGILQDEAARKGWRIGGYESALWWFRKKATPQFLALQRGGVRALDNTLPPVARDYSDLDPFEILVGDQHRFDFWVVDEETGEVFRPEGYFWQDLRTRCFYGGAIDKKYDAYLMGLALRMGLKIFGPFDQIYTDHGKPEESRYIMGIMKDMRALGLGVERTVDVQMEIPSDPPLKKGEEDGAPFSNGGEDGEEINPLAVMAGTHRKAIVRNAKAKMIEGTFNYLEGILRDHLRVPGYVKILGGSQEENEVDQKEIESLARKGKLLTFREFVLAVLKAMDYYNSRKPHRGVRREWASKPKPKTVTPMDCLKMCCADGWKPVRMTEEAIDLVFLPRAERVVDRGRVLLDHEVYEHERLMEVKKGTRVELRYDPLDPDWVLVFLEEKFICKAEPLEYSSMKDKDLAKRKIEEKRRRRKGFILEYRRMTAGVPDIRQFSETKISSEKSGAKARGEEYRQKSAAEIEGEVALIENYNPRRKPIFGSRVERYQWCLDQKELSAEDAAFIGEYEAGMNEDTREYWDIYKESIGSSRLKAEG